MPPVTLVDQRHQQIVICQRPSDQNWDAANKECEPEDNRNIESPGEAESDYRGNCENKEQMHIFLLMFQKTPWNGSSKSVSFMISQKRSGHSHTSNAAKIPEKNLFKNFMFPS